MHLAYLLNSQATSSDNSGFTGDVAGSVDLAADVATVIFLAIGASLTFIFWYIANKPNVLVFPSHTNGVFSVHVRNEGRVAARDVRVECPTYTPSRSDSTESFGVNFLTLQPGEDLEYHIGVGNKVIDHEPYVFAVNHRKWLMLIGRERRVYAIDFSQYRDVIGRPSTRIAWSDILLEPLQRQNRGHLPPAPTATQRPRTEARGILDIMTPTGNPQSHE